MEKAAYVQLSRYFKTTPTSCSSLFDCLTLIKMLLKTWTMCFSLCFILPQRYPLLNFGQSIFFLVILTNLITKGTT